MADQRSTPCAVRSRLVVGSCKHGPHKASIHRLYSPEQVPISWWLVRRDDDAIEVWQRGETTSDDPAFSIPVRSTRYMPCLHVIKTAGAAIGSSSTNF
jgi:hypothetical protein